MICFLGTSHAAVHLRDAADKKALPLTEDIRHADLVFVSEDTPTDESGARDLAPIRDLIQHAVENSKAPIVITSQVPPGFTRALGIQTNRVYHQAETLRIKDATERADSPDYIAVGCPTYQSYSLLPAAYREYLEAFFCPVHIVTYEDAEFSKIAVNMTLAAQVENTNALSEAAKKAGASWWHIAEILKDDHRIGKESYLTPGRWQDSLHLLRDYVTLKELLAR